jgi:hypothetical protein
VRAFVSVEHLGGPVEAAAVVVEGVVAVVVDTDACVTVCTTVFVLLDPHPATSRAAAKNGSSRDRGGPGRVLVDIRSIIPLPSRVAPQAYPPPDVPR